MQVFKTGSSSGFSSIGSSTQLQGDSPGLKEPKDKISHTKIEKELEFPDKNQLNILFMRNHDEKPLSSLNNNVDKNNSSGKSFSPLNPANTGNVQKGWPSGLMGGSIGGIAGLLGIAGGVASGAVAGAVSGAVVGAAGLGNFKFKSETLTIEERLEKKEGEARTQITQMMESLEVKQEDGEQSIVVSQTHVSIGGVVLKKQR